MAAIESCPSLTRKSVEEAAQRISGNIHKTPLLSSRYVDGVASTPQSAESLRGGQWEGQDPAKPRLHILLKCENFQKVGAFKPRGAFNAIYRFVEEQLQEGEPSTAKTTSNDPKPKIRIVSHSSGNHAQAVALAAGELGYPAHIVMPSISTPAKIAATRGYGATVHFSGPTPQERMTVVNQLMSESNFKNVFVPPYDHPDTLLGQGTVGLEIQDQAHEILPHGQKLHAIMTPCGGGGLLSGVALSCAGTEIKVFGSEPSFEGADDCRRGLVQGKRIEQVRSSTVADGLRTPVGEIPWSIISNPEYVQGVFAVTDEQIWRALAIILQRMKILVEPSSAVPLAVALFNEDFRRMIEKTQAPDAVFNIAIVVTGGNVDLAAIPKLCIL